MLKRTILLGLIAAVSTAAVLVADAEAHSLKYKKGTDKYEFLKKAVKHHRYVCNHGKRHPRAWHCKALRKWALPQLRAAKHARAPVYPTRSGFAPLCGHSCVYCETGGTMDPQIKSPDGTYWGWYQFDFDTWTRHGGKPSAYGNAPAGHQTVIASRVKYDAWPNC